MKEVTYKDWQKNPTPRMMWVWDNDPALKKRKKVVYLCDVGKVRYPVVALSESLIEDLMCVNVFKHCAEIKKQKRMTNKELSRWLREKPTREYKDTNNFSSIVYGNYSYMETESSDKVPDNILIREDDGEWREPLVEVEE